MRERIVSFTLQQILKAVDPDHIHHAEYTAALKEPFLIKAYGSSLLFGTYSSKYPKNHTTWMQKVIFKDFVVIARDKEIPIGDAVRYAIENLDMHIKCDCLSGDTVIPLLDGTKPTIAEVVDRLNQGEELYAYSVDDSGNFVPDRIVDASEAKRTRELVEVVLDNGKSIRCTPDHPFIMRDNSERLAGQLKPGDSLMPLYTEYDSRGYEYALRPEGQPGPYRQYIFRKVAERYLPCDIVKEDAPSVHHQDQCKTNNVPSNLVWLTRDDHYRLHSCSKFRPHVTGGLRKYMESNKEQVSADRAKAGKACQAAHPHLVDRLREKSTEYMRSPEGRAQSSDRMKALWSDPNVREPRVAAFTNRANTPEARSRSSAHMVAVQAKLWADPTHAEKVRSRLITANRDHNAMKKQSNVLLMGVSRVMSVVGQAETSDGYDQGNSTRLKKFQWSKYFATYERARHWYSVLYAGKLTASQKAPLVQEMLDEISPMYEERWGAKACCICGATFTPTFATQATCLNKACSSELKSRKHAGVFNHKVVSVQVLTLDTEVPVYDMTMQDTSKFLTGAGIVVHNCPAFLYYGYKYMATKLSYLYGLPKENRPPKIRNPQYRGTVCKHSDKVMRWIVEHEEEIVRRFEQLYRKVDFAKALEEFETEHPEQARKMEDEKRGVDQPEENGKAPYVRGTKPSEEEDEEVPEEEEDEEAPVKSSLIASGVYTAYHGSESEFDEFDPSKAGSSSGNQGYLGKGIYLSIEKDRAEAYGTVKAFKVTLDNPFVINGPLTEEQAEHLNRGTDTYAFEAGTEPRHVYNGLASGISDYPEMAETLSSYLEGEGFDGLVYNGGQEIVVFNPSSLSRIVESSLIASARLYKAYHGSKDAYEAPDLSKGSQGFLYFTDSEEHASRFGTATQYAIAMDNPMRIDMDDLYAATTEEDEMNGTLPREHVIDFVTKAKKEGHDGLIIDGFADFELAPTVYIPFSNDQVRDPSPQDSYAGEGGWSQPVLSDSQSTISSADSRSINYVSTKFPTGLVGVSGIHSTSQLNGLLNSFGRGIVDPSTNEVRLGPIGSSHVGLSKGVQDAKRFYYGYSRAEKTVYVVSKNSMDDAFLRKSSVLQVILSQVFNLLRLSVTPGQKLIFQSDILSENPLASPQFKAWFGKSKVVDGDGNPLPMYHGTKNGGFFQFKRGDLGTHFGTPEQAHSVTGTTPEALDHSYQEYLETRDDEEGDPLSREAWEAEKGIDHNNEGAAVYPVYLRVENPLRLIDRGKWHATLVAPQLAALGIITDGESEGVYDMGAKADQWLIDRIKAAGYDGIVYVNRVEARGKSVSDETLEPYSEEMEEYHHRMSLVPDEEFLADYSAAKDSWMVFDPTQVKSVYNKGTWDPTNPNINQSSILSRDIPSIPPSPQLLKRAIKRYGITDNYFSAFFILPDGKLLSGQDPDGMEGVRDIDHHNVEGLLHGFNRKDGANRSRYDDLMEFMRKSGCVRVDFSIGFVDSIGIPNRDQIRTIYNAPVNSLRITVRRVSGDIAREYEMDEPTPTKIRAFYSDPTHYRSYDDIYESIQSGFYEGDNLVPPTKGIYFHGGKVGQDGKPIPNGYGLVFLSPSRKEAQLFARGPSQGVHRFRVTTDNIFDGFSEEHLERIGEDRGVNEARLYDSSEVEDWFVLEKIQKAGFDGFYTRDYPVHDDDDPAGAFRNLGLFGSDSLVPDPVQSGFHALTSEVSDEQAAANFLSWFRGSKVVDYDGSPLAVYHGTTQEFRAFKRKYLNPMSDWGAGFYFSNTPEDVGHNYAGLGPDLESKIELEYEQDEDYSYYGDPEEQQEIKDRIRRKYMAHEGATFKVYLRIVNPCVVGGEDDTWFDYEEPYNERTGTYGNPRGLMWRFWNNLKKVAGELYGFEEEIVWTDLFENHLDGAYASQLLSTLAGSRGFAYIEDIDNGDLIDKEVIRKTLKLTGFDGIIDYTVDTKFGSQKKIGKAMAGMHEDTVHYVVFSPNQIKSVWNDGSWSRRHDIGSADHLAADELAAGTEVELEHTDDRKEAREIARTHLAEDPRYYSKIAKVIPDVAEAFNKAAITEDRFLDAEPFPFSGSSHMFTAGISTDAGLYAIIGGIQPLSLVLPPMAEHIGTSPRDFVYEVSSKLEEAGIPLRNLLTFAFNIQTPDGGMLFGNESVSDPNLRPFTTRIFATAYAFLRKYAHMLDNLVFTSFASRARSSLYARLVRTAAEGYQEIAAFDVGQAHFSVIGHAPDGSREPVEQSLITEAVNYQNYQDIIDEERFKTIVALDPTPNKKLGKWFMQLYKNAIETYLNTGYIEEDARIGAFDSLTGVLWDSRVVEELTLYAKAVERKKLSPPLNNVMNYKSIGRLHSDLLHSPEWAAFLEDNSQRETTKEIEILYEDSEWVAWIPKTYEASCAYGKGTEWCTATGNTREWWDRYRDAPLIDIKRKSDGYKWQLWDDGKGNKDWEGTTKRDKVPNKAAFLLSLPAKLRAILRQIEPQGFKAEEHIATVDDVIDYRKLEDPEYVVPAFTPQYHDLLRSFKQLLSDFRDPGELENVLMPIFENLGKNLGELAKSPSIITNLATVLHRASLELKERLKEIYLAGGLDTASMETMGHLQAFVEWVKEEFSSSWTADKSPEEIYKKARETFSNPFELAHAMLPFINEGGDLRYLAASSVRMMYFIIALLDQGVSFENANLVSQDVFSTMVELAISAILHDGTFDKVPYMINAMRDILMRDNLLWPSKMLSDPDSSLYLLHPSFLYYVVDSGIRDKDFHSFLNSVSYTGYHGMYADNGFVYVNLRFTNALVEGGLHQSLLILAEKVANAGDIRSTKGFLLSLLNAAGAFPFEADSVILVITELLMGVHISHMRELEEDSQLTACLWASSAQYPALLDALKAVDYAATHRFRERASSPNATKTMAEETFFNALLQDPVKFQEQLDYFIPMESRNANFLRYLLPMCIGKYIYAHQSHNFENSLNLVKNVRSTGYSFYTYLVSQPFADGVSELLMKTFQEVGVAEFQNLMVGGTMDQYVDNHLGYMIRAVFKDNSLNMVDRADFAEQVLEGASVNGDEIMNRALLDLLASVPTDGKASSIGMFLEMVGRLEVKTFGPTVSSIAKTYTDAVIVMFYEAGADPDNSTFKYAMEKLRDNGFPGVSDWFRDTHSRRGVGFIEVADRIFGEEPAEVVAGFRRFRKES